VFPKVRDLKKVLENSDADNRAAAIEHIREIVEKVVIYPTEGRDLVDIEIHGQLAALLRMFEESAVSPLRGVFGCGDRI